MRFLVLASLCLTLSRAQAQRPVARALADEGQRAAQRGQAQRAEVLFERALVADPDYLRIYELVMPIWLARGHVNKAIVALERVTLRHGAYAFGWYALALAYRRADLFERAVVAYRIYLMMRPLEAAPYFGLGISLDRLGRHEQADKAYAQFIARSPDQGDEFVLEARRRRSLQGVRRLWRELVSGR